MNYANNPTRPQTTLLLRGMLLVLLLMILTSCQTKYVPVYLGASGEAWVLREDACRALQQDPITEEEYRSSKVLRDKMVKEDAKWAKFCEVVE